MRRDTIELFGTASVIAFIVICLLYVDCGVLLK